LVLGDYREACASFPWNHLLHREMEIIGSNASAGAWPEAVRLATREAIRLQRLISHRLPVAQFEKGISFLRSKGKDVIKVVLEY
jgi:threonine dehydrogenase-like Zn-dependent dehydrogenase